MAQTFDTIVVIYNPNSTNNAAGKARSFADACATRDIVVELVETTHEGHATEIAEDLVREHTRPLIVSVSGDGGYNEVITGVMNAKKGTQKSPVVAISDAGNANDHKRTTRGDTPLVELVVVGKSRPLDILELRYGNTTRYAHSYIGLGLTPEVGAELNRHQLTRWREALIVLRSFATFAPVTIERNDQKTAYGSIVFANIDAMSKVLKLDTANNKLTDAKFELIAFPWHGKFMLVIQLLKSVLFGNNHAPQLSSYSFHTDTDMPVQFDGEIDTIPANTSASVRTIGHALDSLY